MDIYLGVKMTGETTAARDETVISFTVKPQ